MPSLIQSAPRGFFSLRLRVSRKTLTLMAGTLHEWPDLRVTVDDVVFMPNLDAPAEKPYPFVYFISIHNNSPVSVTLRGRKWVLREANGEVTVVEGDGIVGQMPVIDPGGHFSYSSYHVTAGHAVAAGAFFGQSATGEKIFTRIPEFHLRVPD